MSRTTDDTDQAECTIMDCSGDAEFAYWMPDLGHFSEVRSPEHDFLEDGDLAPYVCESCRDRMAASSHWDEDRFSRPEEKLVTDGGTDSHERLKVTSPRLEQDVFRLTPSGQPDRPDARRLDPDSYSSATRARGNWDDPTPAVETTDTTLDNYDFPEEASTGENRGNDS